MIEPKRVLFSWTSRRQFFIGSIIIIFMLGGGLPGAIAQTPDWLKFPMGLDEELSFIPEDNPLTEEKVALGKQLFFDKRLSADNTIACATCHNPQFGFTDGRPVSIGIGEQRGSRNAPSIINRIFSVDQFWNGRAATLEEQAKGPIANSIEMGFTYEGVVKKLRGIKGYQEQFNQVFGTEEFTIDHIAKAIAAYERTILSGNSPFDRSEAGDKTALSEEAKKGRDLFRDKKKTDCVACHAGFNFTDEGYRNTGVGMDKPNPDLGRYEVTEEDSHKGAFKTPTLRDIDLTAPYFHDGSAKTLKDVVEFYDKGGIKNDWLADEIKPLNLTDEEKAALVEFMKSLTGEISLEVLAPELPK